MRRPISFMVMWMGVLVLSRYCYAEEQTAPSETNRWVSVGMLCSVAESNILASGGRLTQMGWPTGTVYALTSGELIVVVGDGNKTNAVVSRIVLGPCKPTVVTDWPEFKRFELKRMPNTVSPPPRYLSIDNFPENDLASLRGKSEQKVLEILGRPTGKVIYPGGTVWEYEGRKQFITVSFDQSDPPVSVYSTSGRNKGEAYWPYMPK